MVFLQVLQGNTGIRPRLESLAISFHGEEDYDHDHEEDEGEEED